MRTRLDRRLKERFDEQPVRDGELLDLFVAGEVIERVDDDSIEDLIIQIRKRREARRYHRAATRVSPKPAALDPRYEALSRIIAAETSQDARVIRWRERYLGGKLARFEDIDLAVDALAVEEDLRTGDFVALKYLSPVADLPDGSSRITVRRDGVLGYLSWVAQQIGRDDNWTEPRAAAFVLCGLAPPFWPIRSSIRETRRPATTRIVLEIEPRTTREAVADAFDKARQSLELAALEQDSARTVGHKTAELAAFRAEHLEVPARLRPKWNSQFPKWAYEDGRSFGRDLRRAWKAIVGAEYSEPTERTWLKEVWPYDEPPPLRPPLHSSAPIRVPRSRLGVRASS